MKRILESGRFSNYMNQTRLDSATTEISKSYYPRTTVFISHKHDDLKDLSGFIGFLEEKYNVKTYPVHLWLLHEGAWQTADQYRRYHGHVQLWSV